MIDEEIDRYLVRWSLLIDGDRVETPTSIIQPVRRLEGRAILKLLKPTSDEANSAKLLGYYDGKGAVRLYEADDNALLMERAMGPRSLKDMATSGNDIAAADVLAGTVSTLHARRDREMPGALTSLMERFSALFERENNSSLLAGCAAVARRLLATEGDRVPLHGDLHHGNVLDAGDRGWLAIDPKALIGERTYDLANLLRNPVPHGALVHSQDRMKRLADFYARRLGLESQRVLDFAFVHAGLSASWDMEDGEDPGYSIACAETLSPLAMM